MIPLRDDIPSFRRPVVNYVLIALNAAVFGVELTTGPLLGKFIQAYGFVPGRFLYLWNEGGPAGLPDMVLPLFTAMFLHGGWLHLIMNMWVLHIFGDNVEDFLGHGRFLAFYLTCGVVGFLGQFMFSPQSPVPTIGASGAIAGVMGAYFYLYPRARVLTLLPIFFFITILEVPAYFFLGFWFLLQFLSGTFSMAGRGAVAGGVAFWAHVAGFLAGALLLQVFAPVRTPNPFRRRVG
jgi:membrane associated rhomboid family serine protease